jgi:geranylgeranyl pyrophosphate synthase
MARLLPRFLLQYFGTRLDTIMDADTDPPEVAWQGIDQSVGALMGISGIVGAITLGLEGHDLGLNRALSHILQAVQDCIVGQMMDLRGVRSLTEYERAVQLKTGSPLRALLCALASLGDTPPAIELGLAEFGMALGMMKQLNNDVSAIWGERSSNDSDLQKRQLTYPMLFMLEGNHSSATKAAFARLLQEMPGQRDVEQMKQLLESASTVRFINIALIAYARQASEATGDK